MEQEFRGLVHDPSNLRQVFRWMAWELSNMEKSCPSAPSQSLVSERRSLLDPLRVDEIPEAAGTTEAAADNKEPEVGTAADGEGAAGNETRETAKGVETTEERAAAEEEAVMVNVEPVEGAHQRLGAQAVAAFAKNVE